MIHTKKLHNLDLGRLRVGSAVLVCFQAMDEPKINYEHNSAHRCSPPIQFHDILTPPYSAYLLRKVHLCESFVTVQGPLKPKRRKKSSPTSNPQPPSPRSLDYQISPTSVIWTMNRPLNFLRGKTHTPPLNARTLTAFPALRLLFSHSGCSHFTALSYLVCTVHTSFTLEAQEV